MNILNGILTECHKIIMQHSLIALGKIKKIRIKKYNQQQYRALVDRIVIEEIASLLDNIERKTDIFWMVESYREKDEIR